MAVDNTALYGQPNVLAEGSGGMVSPGAAAYQGFQQELLRRQAQQADAEAQARQDALDKQNAQIKMAELENAKTVAAANAEARKAAANKAVLANAEGTMMPGSDIAPDQSAAIKAAGGGGLILGTPMTAGVPSQFAEAPDAQTAASGEVPQTTKETYKGTPEQQLLQAHKDYAQGVVDKLTKKQDNGEDLTPVEQEALFQGNSILMTGKSSTVPAGVVTPKGAGSETNTPEKKFYALMVKTATDPNSVTPEEKAYVNAYAKQHPDEATKQRDAVIKLNITQTGANARQGNQFSNAAQESAYKDLSAKYDKLNLPAIADMMDELKQTGGVVETVAIPKFLSVLTGGMGTGLRMTQSELQMVQNSRPLLDSLLIKAGNVIGINENGYRALTDEQKRQMADFVGRVAQHRIDQGDNITQAQQDLVGKSAPEVRDILAKQRENDLKMFETRMGIKPTAAAGAAPANRRTAKNPTTGEVLYSDNGGPWHK
jgi:microsomal dipeptidase-like Zn-dependent dipeptidase